MGTISATTILTLFRTVKQNTELTEGAKVLYSDILDLSSNYGFSYATDDYFAMLHNVSRRTIQNWMSELKAFKYITSKVFYRPHSKIIERRFITPLGLDLDQINEEDVASEINFTSYEEEQKTSIKEEVQANIPCENNFQITSEKSMKNDNPCENNCTDNNIIYNNTKYNTYINTNRSQGKPCQVNYNSKKIKDVINFIEITPIDISLKEILKKWYIAVGKGRVTITQLNDKINSLNTSVGGNINKMYNTINEAYLNGWFGFFANKEKHDQQFHMQQRSVIPYKLPVRNQKIMLSDEVF